MAQSKVTKAGEAMLIISLVLILTIILLLCLYLFLRRRKHNHTAKSLLPTKKTKEIRQRRRISRKALQIRQTVDILQTVDAAQEQPHPSEKNIAELPDTPLCELSVQRPTPEPTHNTEEMDIADWPLRSNWELHITRRTSSQLDGYSLEYDRSETSSQMDLEIGISWYQASHETIEPDARPYWTRRMSV